MATGVKLVGLQRILARFAQRKPNGDFTAALKKINQILIRSVGLNFAQGGRPNAWARSARADEQAGTGARVGQTLRDTGILGAAIGASGTKSARTTAGKDSKHDGQLHSATGISRIEPLRLVFGVSCPYAAPTHFGFRNAQRGGAPVPARPFLMIQDEDRVKILDLLAKAVTGK